jgi:hypothetical protein
MRTQNNLIESSELSAFLPSLGLFSDITFYCRFIKYYQGYKSKVVDTGWECSMQEMINVNCSQKI